jgi:transposase
MGNSHSSEFKNKKQAIKEFLHSNISQKSIYEKFNKSRSWFRYWLKQFKDKGVKGLHLKSRGYPKGMSRKYSPILVSEIINIRKRLENDPQEYYYGAEIIIQELTDLGYSKSEIPSIPYIKKVLSQKGCVRKTRLKNYTPLKGYPEYFLKTLGILCQIDFIGYKRIHNSNNPIHFLALAYRELKYGNIWRIKAEKSSLIMPLLFKFWQNNPKPDIVQMDNDWAFIGSGSAKGTISNMIKFLLALGIAPLFIPESSPWRNGLVEGLNSVFGKKFWQPHDFKSLRHIDKELVVYNKKTKDYKIKKFGLDISKYKTISQKCYFSKKLIISYNFKNSDVIYFIRLGRSFNKQIAIKILNCKITIPEEFLNHFILSKLYVASGIVILYQETENDRLIEIKKSKIKLKI